MLNINYGALQGNICITVAVNFYITYSCGAMKNENQLFNALFRVGIIVNSLSIRQLVYAVKRVPKCISYKVKLWTVSLLLSIPHLDRVRNALKDVRYSWIKYRDSIIRENIRCLKTIPSKNIYLRNHTL